MSGEGKKNPVEKWREKPRSLRLAINAKCVDCMGGPDAAGYVKEIRECTAKDCSLYLVRPYK